MSTTYLQFIMLTTACRETHISHFSKFHLTFLNIQMLNFCTNFNTHHAFVMGGAETRLYSFSKS